MSWPSVLTKAAKFRWDVCRLAGKRFLSVRIDWSAAQWTRALPLHKSLGVNSGNPEMEIDVICSVFVYGTLKRGQCRGDVWPFEPLGVSRVFTHGMLFDRHDYPAMISGMDYVLGEKWNFRPEQMQQVLEVLDAIEGANQPGIPDLYRRVIVTTWDLGESVSAAHCVDADALGKSYTYHYARDPADDGFTRIMPDQAAQGLARQGVQWPLSPRS